jgi:hypothetical protein
MNVEIGPPDPKYEFHITPKTSNQELGVILKNRRRVRETVAADIVQNARELLSVQADMIPTEAILESVRFDQGLSSERRTPTSAHTIASTIANSARHMGWDMHTPEIVYLSGFHLACGVISRVHFLVESLVGIETGSIRFLTPEHKEEMVRTREDELQMLEVPARTVEEIVQDYARQRLPHDQKYLAILRCLPYMTGDSLKFSGKSKDGVLKQLRRGEVEFIYEDLKQTHLFKEINQDTLP